MAQMTAAVTAVVLIAVVALTATSAFPMHHFRPRYSPPVRLTIHPPVTGADIALARGQAIKPFLNPGISPVGDFVYVDDVLPAVDTGYPYQPDVKSHVIILNKPELDNVNIGGHTGQEFY